MPLSWFCHSHLEILIWDFNLLVTSLLTMLLIQEPNLIYLACYWRLKIAYLGRNWLLCHAALPWARSLQGGRPMGSGLPASTLVLTSALSDGAFGYHSPGNWSAAFTSPKSRTVTWSWEKVYQKLTKRYLKCKKGHLYSNAFQQGRGAWGKVSLADEAHFFFFFFNNHQYCFHNETKMDAQALMILRGKHQMLLPGVEKHIALLSVINFVCQL